ncbi:MAG: glycoside hydrolase family 3 N-terminal domain-containing protein, partial [Candidatus Omnitrophota bacterium]
MKRIKALLLSAVISALACSAGILDAETGPAAEKKIDDIISRMTLDEKVRLIAGNEMETYAINRLGIPQLKMCDGPLGVRHGQATAFPAPAALSATWEPDMVYKVSTALSEEVKAKGRNMSLAPCINILRVPMGGRNFESFGEDPYLTSRLTVAYIKGLQDHNVIATVKHYACNNQEWERGTIDVVVDERALREIYLPGFEAAIKEAGSWSIMDAYNKVNGYHCTENNRLNNEILKEEWGFKGFVVSDWNATHSTVNAAKGGLDLEMPK